MIRTVAVLLALAGLLSTPAVAQKLADIRVSDTKGGAQKTVFKTDTPKVFLTAKPEGISAGRKLRCDWIAVKTSVAPPNYKIDSAEFATKDRMTSVDCSFSKPTAGWPEGDYRVDLFIDGKDAGKVTFKVAK